MYICIYIYIHIHTCIYIYIYIYIYMHIYTSYDIFLPEAVARGGRHDRRRGVQGEHEHHRGEDVLGQYTCMSIYNICNIYIYIYIERERDTYMYTHAYIHSSIHVYTHIYIYIYTHLSSDRNSPRRVEDTVNITPYDII